MDRRRTESSELCQRRGWASLSQEGGRRRGDGLSRAARDPLPVSLHGIYAGISELPEGDSSSIKTLSAHRVLGDVVSGCYRRGPSQPTKTPPRATGIAWRVQRALQDPWKKPTPTSLPVQTKTRQNLSKLRRRANRGAAGCRNPPCGIQTCGNGSGTFSSSTRSRAFGRLAPHLAAWDSILATAEAFPGALPERWLVSAAG